MGSVLSFHLYLGSRASSVFLFALFLFFFSLLFTQVDELLQKVHLLAEPCFISAVMNNYGICVWD